MSSHPSARSLFVRNGIRDEEWRPRPPAACTTSQPANPHTCTRPQRLQQTPAACAAAHMWRQACCSRVPASACEPAAGAACCMLLMRGRWLHCIALHPRPHGAQQRLPTIITAMKLLTARLPFAGMEQTVLSEVSSARCKARQHALQTHAASTTQEHASDLSLAAGRGPPLLPQPCTTCIQQEGATHNNPKARAERGSHRLQSPLCGGKT